MIGFYRPLVFVLLKIQFIAFSWENPAGYMATSIVFHVINALLVGLLAKKVLRVDTPNGVLASLIFLLSPWAGEALFWSSCQFDIFATMFMVSALILTSKRAAFYDSFHTNAAHILTIAALALSALFSKELSATLPGLFIVVMLYNYKIRELLKNRYVLSIFSLLTVCVLIYISTRTNYMTELGGAFGGAYGDFFTLLKNTGPLNFTNTILMPPISNAPFYSLGGKLYLILMVVIFVSALVYRPRATAITFLAFLISILPVIWIGQLWGRFLYIPSIFVSLCLSIGICQLKNKLDKQTKGNVFLSRSYVIGIVFIFTYMLFSLNYQKDVWFSGHSINRQVIEVFQEYKDKDRRFYITNLPSALIPWPIILKSYAFPYYFQDNIEVRADTSPLHYKAGGLLFENKHVSASSSYQKETKELVITFDVREIE